MKKCFDITRLLCLSVLLSVFCFSSVLAAPAGEAPALRVALLLEDAAPDQGWNDLLRQGLEQARKELGVRTAVVVAPPQGSNGLTQEGIFRAAARQADLVLLSGPACTRTCATMPPTSGRRSSAVSIRASAPPTSCA